MFTAAFWRTTAENIILSGATAFGGALNNSNGQPTLKDLGAAGIAAGLAAIYTLIKQLGGVQAAAGILKVKVGL